MSVMNDARMRAAFHQYFAKAMGKDRKPFPYQERLALEGDMPALLDIPTGLGKTAAIILAWLWRRRFAKNEGICNATPRRLIYCLPMRVLVEQTQENAKEWLTNLGILARGPGDDAPTTSWAREHGDRGRRIAISLLMGGENTSDWTIWPERDSILIGTQDMLLSRALNRGYAASRARWPMEFGLLHNDSLWTFDEVQLMGSGLATTAQLDAFAKALWKPVRTAKYFWMSATLGDSFLQTRDRCDWNLTIAARSGLEQPDFDDAAIRQRLQAEKKLHPVMKDRPKATTILQAHVRGRVSLVILNTVSVAKSIFWGIKEELAKPIGNGAPRLMPEVCLLHSRFRAMDRDRQLETVHTFLARLDETGAVPHSDGLIVVSTQVVEAGFDLSSVRLWSEVAPWPSVVQRLGRLNRDGLQTEASAYFWMPKADEQINGAGSPNASRIGPYEKKSLNVARKLLDAIIAMQMEGDTYRDALDAIVRTPAGQEAVHVEPDVVIRPADFFELYSTEPDVTGGFTNVSQFVRDQDRNVDVQVFWRDFDVAKVKQPPEAAPIREELCSVPLFEFRQFLVKSRWVWEWNFETDCWESRRPADVQPGMTLLLPQSAGGYRWDVGWTGAIKDRDFEVSAGTDDCDSLNADMLNCSQEWVTLADHLADVKAEMHEIALSLGLEETLFGDPLIMAARWHDCGKSASKWQGAMKVHIAKARDKLAAVTATCSIPNFSEVAKEWQRRLQSKDYVAELWGKFPNIRAASLDDRLDLSAVERANLSKQLRVPFRPPLRHEAASGLAAWQSWLAKSSGLTALSVYLVASHHGKVRTVLRSRCGGNDVFGLIDGTMLPPVANLFPSPVQLCTDAKFIGACGTWNDADTTFILTSPSWVQMIAELLGPQRQRESATFEVIPACEPRDLGPLTLAYLEALLRAADVRASNFTGKSRKA